MKTMPRLALTCLMTFVAKGVRLFLGVLFLLFLNTSVQAQELQEGEFVFREFPGYSITHLFPTDDGGYLFLARSLLARPAYPTKGSDSEDVYLWGKINSSGSIEFTKNISIRFTYIYLIEQMSPDHFMLITEQPLLTEDGYIYTDDFVLMNMDATGYITDSIYYSNGDKNDFDCFDYCTHFEPSLFLGFEEDNILLFGQSMTGIFWVIEGPGYFVRPVSLNIRPNSWSIWYKDYHPRYTVPDSISEQASFRQIGHRDIIQRKTSANKVFSLSTYSAYYWTSDEYYYPFYNNLIYEATGKQLVKTEASGEQIWAKASAAVDDIPIEEQLVSKFNIAVTNDGAYVLLGTEEDGKVYLYRYTADGDFLWKRSLNLNEGLTTPEENIYRLEPTIDNGFIIVYEVEGRLWIQKVNEDGYLRWEKSYGETQALRKLQAPIITGEMEYTTGGYYQEEGIYYPYLLLNQAVVDNVLLAVELHYFTAEWLDQKARKTQLEWQTATEEQISHFVVERSTDGHHFKQIASIKAKNREQGAKYTYIDELSTSLAQSYYYRLKVIEQDGRSKQQFLASVEGIINTDDIMVNFDPSTAQLLVKMSHFEASAAPILCNIYQIDGQLYQSFKLHSNEQVLPLDLPSGVYIWELQSKGKQVATGKIVK